MPCSARDMASAPIQSMPRRGQPSAAQPPLWWQLPEQRPRGAMLAARRAGAPAVLRPPPRRAEGCAADVGRAVVPLAGAAGRARSGDPEIDFPERPPEGFCSACTPRTATIDRAPFGGSLQRHGEFTARAGELHG